MKANRSFKGQPCAYCAKGLSTRTGDHLPDRKLLGRVDKKPRIPCCLNCNKYYNDTKDNKRMQLLLVTALQTSDNVPDSIKDSLHRGLRKGHDRSVLHEISITPGIWLKDPKTGLYQESGLFNQKDSSYLTRYTERLVKGFHFFKNQAPLPTDHDIVFAGTAGVLLAHSKDGSFVDIGEKQLMSNEVQRIRTSNVRWQPGPWSDSSGKSVFECRFFGCHDVPYVGLWEFLFYQHLWLSAFIFRKGKD